MLLFVSYLMLFLIVRVFYFTAVFSRLVDEVDVSVWIQQTTVTIVNPVTNPVVLNKVLTITFTFVVTKPLS